MELTLSLLMDFILLSMLGVTIFYALRLSKSLNNFKAHRQDFENLMQDLTKNIEQAYTSIETLKEAGSQSGEELREAVSEAKYLLDELQLVNVSSENLAHRLEKAGEKSRVPDYNKAEHFEESEDEERAAQPWAHMLEKHDKDPADDQGGFMIRDHDLETGSVTSFGDKHAKQKNDNDDGLQSQAERELFAALNQNKK